MHLAPRPFAGTPVTGSPYSVRRVTEHVQTAMDGTRFTTANQQETIYRDSQGRTRTERPLAMGPNAPDAPLLVEISDPATNVGYTLDTQNRVAHRFTYSAPPDRQTRVGSAGVAGGGMAGRVGSSVESVPPPQPTQIAPPLSTAGPNGASTATVAAAPGDRPHPEIAHEDLGTQVIEGVMAKGQRFVQTWPAGSQGNDRPFQTTSETWFSPDLNMTVLTRNVDPRSGENIMKLININRAEPDPTLFAPPPDYKVAEETGSFEIQWTGTRRQ